MAATSSLASNLKDVRVGPHGEYTRVVLETDAKTSYSLNQTAGVVTIELQASSTPRAVTAKSQQLSWVRVEPIGASTLVKIELKSPARVKQMVLTGPNRIVLDVFGDASAATATAPEPARKPVAAPAEPVAPAPKPAPAVATTASPRIEDEDALIRQEAADLLGPEAGPVPGDAIAATEGVPGEGARGDAVAGTEAATPAASAAEAPKPAIVRRATKPSKGLFEWIQDPWILGGLAIVMLALVVILWRRRPAAAPKSTTAEEEPSASSLFGVSSEATGASEAADGASIGAAAEPPSLGGAGAPAADGVRIESGSAFEFEAPDAEPEKPDLGRAHGALHSTIGAVTSTAAYETQAPTATGGLSMAELDRRLALLEQRLEEVIDAKDRLERQVSAQTEELRVQRAAIARTQRVLRTVVRPEDDQASEPVLKT
ncbi:MAG TPA: hypothetical protein VII78_07275 [Myxococcota bacterium]